MAAFPEEVIFQIARQIDRPEARQLYLDQVCGADDAVRARINALLRVHDEERSFLEHPVVSPPVPGLDAPTVPPGELPPTAAFEPPPVSAGAFIAGRYKLLEEIGEGGMGSVWMAEQTEPLQRRIAVKLIKPGMDSRQVVARFEAERQALALMDHPNIAKVLDGGATPDGRPYFVMELVKGTPITKFCDEKKLNVRERLELFGDVCRAVQHAHQKGIIHRDLKPSNVLVAPYDGRPVVKVIDFGVAKATGQKLTEATLFTGFGAVVGTPEYMSPEQAEVNNQDIDTRSDIYSLGVLLYELLTGSTPLTRKRAKDAAFLEVLRVIREEEPPKPSTRLSSTEELPSISAQRQSEPAKLTKLVRGELDWIVMKALEKDRNRRYETANGFAADLQRYLADEPVQACPPSVGYRFGKLVRKHKRALATAAGFMLLLIAGVIVSSWLAVRATKAEHLAGERLVEVEGARSKLQDALAETKAAHGKTSAALADTKAANEATNMALDSLRDANEKTKEALKVSEEARKQAEEVSRFMTEAFSRASPSRDGRSVKVADLLDEAEAKLATRMDLSPLVRAELYAAISQTYHGLQMRAEAIRTGEHVWQLRKQELGKLHQKTISALYHLHVYSIAPGKFDAMASRFEETLKEGLATWGPDHPTNRSIAFKTITIWTGSGRPENALALLERYPALLITRGRADDLEFLEMLSVACNAYAAAGRCEDGVKLMEKHIAEARSALGPDNIAVLTGMYKLADVWWSARYQGDQAEIQTKAAKAKGTEQRERTLAQARVSLGNEHFFTMNCLNQLALDMSNVRRHARAAELYAEMLEHNVRLFGADSFGACLSGMQLGGQLTWSGQYEKAIPVLEKVLSNKARFADEQMQQAMLYLGAAYQEKGDFKKADALLTSSLELSRKRPPDAFFTTMVTLLSARNKIRLGQFDDAAKLLDSVVANLRAAGWQSQRGALLLEQKQFAEAEKLLLGSHQYLANYRLDFPTGLHFQDSLDSLVKLYEDWGKADEAKKWRSIRDKAKMSLEKELKQP